MSVQITDKPVNGGALSRLMSIVKSVFWPKSQVEEARMVTLGEAAMADISTDVSADAASDTKVSSPKSVKTYVDGTTINEVSLTVGSNTGTPTGTASISGRTLALSLDGIKGADGEDGDDGTDGVGIASVVQTTASSESGGTNVVRITLTNNTYVDVEIKNGNAVGSVTVSQTTGDSTSATMSQKAITDHVKKIPVLLHDYTHTAERLYATAVEQVTENNETFWKYTFDPSTAPSWMPEVGNDAPVGFGYVLDGNDPNSVGSASKVPKTKVEPWEPGNSPKLVRLDNTHFRITSSLLGSFYMSSDVNLGSFYFMEGLTDSKPFDISGWRRIRVVMSPYWGSPSRYRVFRGLCTAYQWRNDIASRPYTYKGYVSPHLIYSDVDITFEFALDGDDKVMSNKVCECKYMTASFENSTTSNTNKTVETIMSVDGDSSTLVAAWRCPKNAMYFRVNQETFQDGTNIKIYGLEKFE